MSVVDWATGRRATRLDDEPTFRCALCQDGPGGWILPLRCPDVRCERQNEHGPHTFTARCPCWLNRHAEQLRQRGQAAISKGQRPSADYDALLTLEEGRYRWARPRGAW